MGFQNFDMDCFGVASPQLKRLAKKPELNLPIIKVGNSKSKVIEWQGLRIKNLETLGERSATGMDSERGVYVVTIIDVYSQLKDFIRANDVILKFNGKAINNLNDLLEATKMADLTKPIEIEVFRNQMELMVVIPANSIIKK